MKLSIITVNLNNVRGLHKTMESILSQTCNDFEWIVIDGGSTDGSKDLIEQNAEHIAYWVSEPDRGIYHAMNKGIKVAKGNYLNFLNSGDYYWSNEVVKQFSEARLLDDVIYANSIFVDSEGHESGRQCPPACVPLSYFWSNNFNHQSVFYHRRCFDNYLFDEQNRIHSDKESYMYLLYHGFSFKKWNQVVAYCEAGGLSSNGNGSEEFPQIVSRVLPAGIRTDYETFIKLRDVDLAIIILKIIDSNRFWRNLTRVFLYPINFLSQKFHS